MKTKEEKKELLKWGCYQGHDQRMEFEDIIIITMVGVLWNMAAGTLNSDEPRDLKLPLKDRFFLQPLSPTEAAQRAKESAKEIVGVKKLIEKKAWPYVQNDLRLRAEYLRFDLNTVIAGKPKDEKKSLKELTGKLFQDISNVS